MFDEAYTRRSLLRRGTAAAVGAGAIASTAGCLGFNPLGGGTGYTSWLPAPDALDDSDHYFISVTDTEALASNEDDLGGEPDSLESTWEPAGFDWDDTSMTLSLGFYTDVVRAEFSREDVVDDLEDADFEADTDHEGYTIYRSSNEQQAFGVTDGTLVVSELGYGAVGDADPVDRVETVIDADNGDVERYTEASEDMGTLVEKLGGGALVSARTYEEPDEENAANGNFEHSVGQGTTISIDGETSEYTTVVLYEDGDDVDTGDLEDWVDANDGSSGDEGTRFDDIDDISYDTNGRAGVIVGTIDTDELYADS